MFATTTLTPVADAFVRDGATAGLNFGTESTLVVKGSPTIGNTRRTYLKFDISGLEDADTVALRLFGSASAASPAVSLSAFGVGSTAWGETTLNWNNKPATTGVALSTRSIAGMTDKSYEWDVTSFVKAAITAGDTFVSLAVQSTTSSTSNPTADFDAREGANDPQLVVTTDDDTPPPAGALRIDAAGGPTAASGGVVFGQDSGFTGGFANTDVFAVAGTTDDALYATRRTGDFTYANAVPNGDYTLRLLFADYKPAGQRKFNVGVEGQQVLTNLDIVAEAGQNVALVKSFPVTISDGKLDLSFTSVVSYAALSAFELIPEDPGTPPAPSLSINDVTKNEGDSGTTPFTFTVTRSGDATVPVTVQYATSDQTASASDYVGASGTVSFAAGETSQQLTLSANGDTSSEPNETFLVTLSNPTGGATIADGTGVGTILNDDSAGGPAPTLAINDAMAAEGNSGTQPLIFTVTRAGDTSGSSTVNWATQNGTAGDGDYQVANGSLSFAPGQASKTITIGLKGDTKVEGDETFFVNLSGATGATIADAQGTGTIANDDTTTPATGISNITWTRNAPRSPVPRTEAGSVQIGNKLYVIGGFTSVGGTGSFFPLTRRVHVYDLATRQWQELAALPNQAAGNHFGVATDGANIYTVAGQVQDTYGAGTSTTWRYNIAANQWTQFVSLPEVRFGGAAFVENGWLHFAGGDRADRETPTTDHWAIDLSNPSGGWQRRANVPQPGDHASHATINGKVYLFGGEHGHHGLNPGDENGYIQHNYTFEYDPVADSWRTRANMPLALSHIEGTTLVINGKAVLIGGLLTGGGSNTTNRVHVYDPVGNTWKTLSTRYPKRIIGGVAGYWNGKVYMTDGYSPDESDRSIGFEGTVVFG